MTVGLLQKAWPFLGVLLSQRCGGRSQMWFRPQPDSCLSAQGGDFPGIQGRTQQLDSETVKEETPREFLGLVLAWLQRWHCTTRWHCVSVLGGSSSLYWVQG